MNNKILKINFSEIHGNLLSIALVASLLVLGIAYIYLINTSVFLVNARGLAEEKRVQTESELAILETNYISAQETIDMSLATAHGFVAAPKDSTFAYRTKPADQETSLSFLR
ncbi:MAG: hypothetical protein A2556_00685 [Candidatus Vogelbacteria bacterium RIFOXYD2_FULL_44_9]|uniref:Cell division protein FtsL n=1 Tax=Candidatus Vogelbacteria bacterium RIFOXYD2_FULL_44_9 TaxID=1802441 RepID=A0A1G2QQQ7_9BACT|nr:MAG: hypothetical protein A2556_00685 [Candidatus Vogelbacteria bacterium RIFOXYD2_FULL_44_9]